MYGLPDDFDHGLFVGSIVEAVSFTANTVHVVFSTDLSVTLAGSFEHGDGSGAPPTRSSIPVTESSLMRLIGNRAASVTVHPPGSLVLHFEDGQTLTCIDDSAEYESYVISFDGRQIVV